MTNVTPYLEAQRTRAEAYQTTILAVQQRAVSENRDLTDEEVRTIAETAQQIEETDNQIRALEDFQKRSGAVGNLAAKLESARREALPEESGGFESVGFTDTSEQGPQTADQVMVAPKLMPPPDQLRKIYKAAAEQRSERFTLPAASRPAHARAAVTLGATGTPVASLDVQAPNEPRRISTAARIAVQQVSGTEDVVFPVFGSGDAAGIVAEGALKPEFDAVTAGNAQPQMISIWTDYSRQVELSIPSFEQRLRAKLAALVARREDQLMVARVTGTAGIQTYAAPVNEAPADSLLVAAGKVLDSDVAAAPDLAVVNPADLVRLFGSSTGAAGESPEAELRLQLRGMNVYPSSAVAAGTAIVGAWAAASRFVVGLAPSYLVDAVSQLKNNLITLLLEEAVTLAIDEPTGFCSVTFDDGVA